MSVLPADPDSTVDRRPSGEWSFSENNVFRRGAMKSGYLLTCVGSVFVAVMTASAPAHATDYRMLVLIDASGSMAWGPPGGVANFENAKNKAVDDLGWAAGLLLHDDDTLKVAVYTFTCPGAPCTDADAVLV